MKSGITPAKLCPFVNFNINDQLRRFDLNNGPPQDPNHLLNEKWESLALLPANGDGKDKKDSKDEYYLISVSDNDFITQNGTSPWSTQRLVLLTRSSLQGSTASVSISTMTIRALI